MITQKLQSLMLVLTALVLSVTNAYAQPLNGTYTVGGTSPNYASVAAAVTALQNSGVNGPVTFNIRPGTYATSVTIPTITGASTTNRITFRAESGRGTVNLTTTATSSINNFVVRFTNASFITFREVTLTNSGVSFGTVIDLVGSSANDSIVNCLITGATTSSTSTLMSRIFANGVTGSNNAFVGDSIVRGSYSIYTFGNNTARPVNTVISGNTLVNPFFGSIYAYHSNDLKIRNNNAIVAGVGQFQGFFVYECDNALEITGNTQTITGATSINYGLYMWYCNATNAQRGIIANNTFTSTTSSTTYPWFLYYNSHDSFANNTINATTTFSTIWNNNYYADSTVFRNNNITMSTQSGSLYPIYTDGSGFGRNLSFQNNTFTANTTTGWIYNYPMLYTTNSNFSGNTITLASSLSGGVLNYMYYNTNYVCANNTINCSSGTSGTVYGLYSFNTLAFPNNSFFNNRISATSGTGFVFGLYVNGHSGINRFYNNSIYSRTSGTNYTVDYSGSQPGTHEFYNNTVCNAGTSSGTNFTIRSSNTPSTGGVVTYRNNVIAKTSANGFPPLWVFDNTFNVSDYNNIFTPGTALVSRNGVPFTTLNAWRVASGMDRNSISFDPAFTNAAVGNLVPNTSSPSVWSINGRGVHIEGNNADMLGNTRAVLPFTGVPDIGAYEIVPAAGVLPPSCVVVPAAPAPGITQTFTFGQDTVATITWDAASTAPSVSPDVRQFTASVPTAITTINPTFMYFYDSISLAGNFNYTANIYYKSPWMGTIASEPALRLAKRNGTSPWIGYPSAVSGSNVQRKFIFSPASPMLNDYGIYTGIDIGNNASANAIVQPSGFFCQGNYMVTLRVRNAGNNVLNSVRVNWEQNGSPQTPINITTPIPVNNGTPGSNDILVPLGNVFFGPAPVTIKAWTSLPNNVTDPVPGDDTLQVTLRSALQGDYTVGGASPNFPTVAAAVTALNQVGICGPVTFNIRPGTYVGQLAINNIVGSSPANRITFQAENGDPSSVNISFTPTSSADNFVVRLNNASNLTFRNLTILSGTSSWGYVIVPVGTLNNDSLIGCNIISGNLTSSLASCIYAANVTGSNFVVQNCNLENSYWPVYWFGASNNYYNNFVIQNSNITNGWAYSTYIWYINGFRFLNNNITTNTTLTFHYGLFAYFLNQSPQIANNRITLPTGYPMYLLNTNGTSANRCRITNNMMATGSNTNFGYGLYISGSTFTDVHHNSISLGTNNTSSYPGYFFFSSPNNDVRNNVFANMGGGPVLYYWNNQGLNNTIDFNNLFTTNTSSPQIATNPAISGTPAATMAAWRTLTNQDRNSLSANPGFMSLTNLTPDPTNPNCWALNGRATQLTSANNDINGLPRVTNRANGVPDLGAAEFEPSSIPPNSIAVPAVPAPGVTQNFLYGQNNVATVRWNTQLGLTSILNVKQYSGAIAPANFPVISQNKYPYFYTNITPTGVGSTYDFDFTLNYYDTWLGTIPNEANMKLAHKFGATPWVSYNEANSSSNVTNNNIFAAGVTSFGDFTGIEDGINFSANVKMVGSAVACTGNSVTLNASPVSSGSTTYTYQWRRNGVDIPGAINSSYVASAGGDYTVLITATSVVPNKTAESIPVSVTVV
ncbi:hypothetical protein CAP35_07820, partial [Chitinophagaceae bacterium IBVUCB1]